MHVINERAGDSLRVLLAGIAAESPDARLFTFSDGKCALTPSGQTAQRALETFVERAGTLEPYLNTRSDISGQSTADVMVARARQLTAEAGDDPNVTINADGTISAPQDLVLRREDFGSEQLLQDLGGNTHAISRPYAVDAAAWDSMSADDRINAISTYAVERDCASSRVVRIAKAIRDGRFSVIDDSVAHTLAAWCAGKTPSADDAGPADTGTPSSPSSSTDAPSSSDTVTAEADQVGTVTLGGCGRVEFTNRYDSGRLRVYAQDGIGCAQARDVVTDAASLRGTEPETVAEGWSVGAYNCWAGREGEDYAWWCATKARPYRLIQARNA
jgi:hypothetical protein